MNKPEIDRIQNAIRHIQTAVDVDPWAVEIAVKALEKQVPKKPYERGKRDAELEPKWIPCSERLPEAEYPVIVTWMNNDPASYYQYILGKHYTGVAHYKNGKWYWYSSVTEDVLMEYGKCDSEEFDEAIEVIAWMPLPEPYQRGETNE